MNIFHFFPSKRSNEFEGVHDVIWKRVNVKTHAVAIKQEGEMFCAMVGRGTTSLVSLEVWVRVFFLVTEQLQEELNTDISKYWKAIGVLDKYQWPI